MSHGHTRRELGRLIREIHEQYPWDDRACIHVCQRCHEPCCEAGYCSDCLEADLRLMVGDVLAREYVKQVAHMRLLYLQMLEAARDRAEHDRN